MILQKNGYAVVTADSGETALSVAQDISEIDLILMDIDLGGGMDGTQTAEIILQDRDVPLAFLSSHTEPEVLTR